MKIDLTTTLKTPDGAADLRMSDSTNSPAATLRNIVQPALTNLLKGDDERDGQYKNELWNLAVDCRQDEVDWTPEQLTIVRDRVNRAWPAPLISGQSLALLGG